MAKNWSALIWRKFAKHKVFAQYFDSPTFYSLWMHFGKCKLCSRVKIELFLCKFPFNSNEISNFWKTYKRFVWINKLLHLNEIWRLFNLYFDKFMHSDLNFSFQFHLNFHFSFIFAEKLNVLVCKVLWQKPILFCKINLLV